MKNLLAFWQTQSPRARLMIAAGAAVIVVGTIALAWWAAAPSYAVLFKDVNPDDAAAIATDLEAWHVPYRVDVDGQTLLVPAGVVAETRMRLASEGLPSHGTVGFELFNQTDYGMTDFTQQVDYQRALQGELERTVMSLAEVKSARVHITLKQKGLFLQSEDHPKASVTLSLKPGRSVDAAEIGGIQRLIAAAVDGLDAKDVVVLDDSGAPLSSPDLMGSSAGDVDARLGEKQRVEDALHDKIERLLKSVFGPQRFAVSINVALNFDKIKDVDQEVIPQGTDGNGLVTMRRETRSAPTAAAVAGAAPSNHDGTTATDVEYAHSTSVKETEYAAGRVEHVSVGVLVPDTMSPSQVQQLHNLVAAAMGYDATRGDRIDVSPWDFAQSPTDAHAPTQPVDHDGATPTYAAARGTSRVFSSWTVGVALAALLLASILFFVRARKPALRRLDGTERQAVLNEVRTWLTRPEAAPRD